MPHRAAAFTQDELLRGYALRNDSIFFLFDNTWYANIQPSKVVVSGTFSGWHQDMNVRRFHLSALNSKIWSLEVDNCKHLIPLNEATMFKFRVSVSHESGKEVEGVWLDAPANAPNAHYGHLLIQSHIKPLIMKAELKRQKTIWVHTEGLNRSFDKSKYRLTDSKGHEIPLSIILPNTASDMLIVPQRHLDMRRSYFLEIPHLKLKTHCSFDGWFREVYSEKELGANVGEDGKYTVFRIFSPRSTAIRLYLYHEAEAEEAYEEYEMQRDPQGIWECLIDGDLHGIYYDFTVHGFDEVGNHFHETTPTHISDPYARVNVDSWGRSRVWRKMTPPRILKKGIPPMQNLISYEVHIQDFTSLLPVPEAQKGTIPAMHQSGLKNSKGFPIGFDYLIDLGVNVVHLMPVQEFLHYPEKEWRTMFEHDEYMKKVGINLENYEWGYRTSHAFAIESNYREKGTEYGAQREQFRDMVDTFHAKGMAVIIDIVPNHTAEAIDNLTHYFHFNVLDKLYYYRTKNFEHIGDLGNEVKTENRPMVQRWLIDQCRHFIEEFGIDGFRIDLAGLIDEQTLLALIDAIGADKIVYGEPWIGSKDPDFEGNPDWDWYKSDSPITFFQDESRNYFKGNADIPYDKLHDRGYAGGNTAFRDGVKMALANKFPDEKSPIKGISYLDIHDNWALADTFAKTDWDGRKGVEEDRYKIAAVLLYTSLGPIVLHGGTEIMRSKGLAGQIEDIRQLPMGAKIYLHGKKDTYNLRTPNQFIWENVGGTIEEGFPCDYKGMYAFWRGLNRFRLSEYGKVFRRSDHVSDYYYQWFEPDDRNLLGYMIDQKVLVLLNVADYDSQFYHIWIPEGSWLLIADNSGVNHKMGVSHTNPLAKFEGNRYYNFPIPRTGLRIWVREHTISLHD
jgi:pullulanase